MILLVDIGNSRVKWAVAGPQGLVGAGTAAHRDEAALGPLFTVAEAPDEIRVADVAAGAVGDRVVAALARHYGRKPRRARAAAAGAGVRNGYTDPGQLGVDRWLALCAAYARHPAPLCVVDAGTATTIDLVTGDGNHLGGLILPGVGLMTAALFGSTGHLARLAAAAASTDEPDAGLRLGRDTATAIHAAALQAGAALILQSLPRLGPAEPLLVFTGGDGAPLLGAVRRLSGATAPRWVHRPELVLEGLALQPLCFAEDPGA